MASGEEDDGLRLTLGFVPFSKTTKPVSQSPPPTEAQSNSSHRRTPPTQTPGRCVRRRTSNTDTERIQPPYPWATDQPCRLYTMEYLNNNGHTSITGTIKCRKCNRSYEVAFDLQQKLADVLPYMINIKEERSNRAPDKWMRPTLPDCKFCGEKKSLIPETVVKERINWLFLFLGEMIGCCKLEDLKHFLSKNNSHMTGSKDRLLYLVYMNIVNQLMPNGSSDV